MKQILLTAVMLLIINSPIHAKNKISMVTYFPVPYVAYSQVNATEQMDIGLTGACDMKLGCSEESATLNAARVNLKSGKLNLDGGRGIKGNTLVLGNGMSVGQISFQNVRIQTGNMESVNANSMNVNALNLFGKTFPSCKAANGESNGQMQWANLKLKGASVNELYLTCGNTSGSVIPSPEPDPPTCSDRTYKLAHKSICCPVAAKTDTDCYSEILEWTFVKGGIVEGGDDCPRFQAGASKECTQKEETCELETSCQRVGRDADRCFSSRYKCSFSGEYKQLW